MAALPPDRDPLDVRPGGWADQLESLEEVLGEDIDDFGALLFDEEEEGLYEHILRHEEALEEDPPEIDDASLFPLEATPEGSEPSLPEPLTPLETELILEEINGSLVDEPDELASPREAETVAEAAGAGGGEGEARGEEGAAASASAAAAARAPRGEKRRRRAAERGPRAVPRRAGQRGPAGRAAKRSRSAVGAAEEEDSMLRKEYAVEVQKLRVLAEQSERRLEEAREQASAQEAAAEARARELKLLRGDAEALHGLSVAELAQLAEELASTLARVQREHRQRCSQVEDERLCVICFTERKNVVVQPCSHCAMCETCFARCSSRCPQCRTPIKGHLKIYI